MRSNCIDDVCRSARECMWGCEDTTAKASVLDAARAVCRRKLDGASDAVLTQTIRELSQCIEALDRQSQEAVSALTADDLIRRYLLCDDIQPVAILALAPAWEASGEPSFFKWLAERVAALKASKAPGNEVI